MLSLIKYLFDSKVDEESDEIETAILRSRKNRENDKSGSNLNRVCKCPAIKKSFENKHDTASLCEKPKGI